MQTVPGAGEVHVKEEASEFIVSSHTIFLFLCGRRDKRIGEKQ